MITRIEDYFARGCGRCARFDTPECSALRWREGILALRRICLAAGLTEALKWGHPCYVHAGRNIALLGAFRADFRISFLNAALLRDPAGVLQPAGPNSQTAECIRFDRAEAVAERAASLRDLLDQAMDHAERGTLTARVSVTPDLPADVLDLLAADPALAAAYAALTPGRRRGYALSLAGARTPETRARRLAGFRDHILAGKGPQGR